MKRALLLTAAAATFASPALARPLDPGFNQNTIDPVVTISRADAASIRSCATEFGGAYTAVCYNQVTNGTASLLGVPVLPFSWSKERVVRVSCDRRFPRTDKSTRGRVAIEFCPQVKAGTLKPAPFLL